MKKFPITKYFFSYQGKKNIFSQILKNKISIFKSTHTKNLIKNNFLIFFYNKKHVAK